MFYSSSKAIGRVPLTLVCGEQSALRRLFVSRLLRQLPPQSFKLLAQRPESTDAFHEHDVQWFDGAMGAVDEDCLCCGLRSGLGDALRSIFLSALSARGERLERGLIDAGNIRAEQLQQTLKHTPFLGQRFVYQATLWVLDPSEFDVQRLGAILFGVPSTPVSPLHHALPIGCLVVHQPPGWEIETFETTFENIQKAACEIYPEIAVVRLFSETLASDMGLLPSPAKSRLVGK
jgi:hypothetical protein